MFSKRKTKQGELARQLRRTEGASIKEIARRIGAAQPSISPWVRDVELSDEQKDALVRRAYDGHVKGRTINSTFEA
jgi:transposase-like protein